MRLPEPKDIPKSSLLEPNPLNWWSRPENIAQVQIDGENSWALLDSGSTINAVTPEFVEVWFFGCWSLEWLVQWYPGYKWFWRSILLALGLCYHKGSGGRSLGLWHEDQVALVIPDSTGFGSWVQLLWVHPPSIGSSTCDQGKWNQWVVSFPEWIKDSPIVSLFSEQDFWFRGKLSQTKLWTQLTWMRCSQNNKEGRSGCFFIQNNTWPNENPAPGKQHACNDPIPERGDGPHLPHGLSVVNTYTKVISGSKWVAVVVKNLMATLITIAKGVKVAQVVAANAWYPQWK